MHIISCLASQRFQLYVDLKNEIIVVTDGLQSIGDRSLVIITWLLIMLL